MELNIEEMLTGIIYKATNIINGKCYIGQAVNFNRRKNNHLSCAFNINALDYNCHFHRAIRKYGKENFEWETVYKDILISGLNVAEVCAVYTFDSFGENG